MAKAEKELDITDLCKLLEGKNYVTGTLARDVIPGVRTDVVVVVRHREVRFYSRTHCVATIPFRNLRIWSVDQGRELRVAIDTTRMSTANTVEEGNFAVLNFVLAPEA